MWKTEASWPRYESPTELTDGTLKWNSISFYAYNGLASLASFYWARIELQLRASIGVNLPWISVTWKPLMVAKVDGEMSMIRTLVAGLGVMLMVGVTENKI